MPDFFAPCPRGLEKLLAEELTSFGAAEVRVNDGGVAALIERTGREVLGPDRVITDEPPSMGAEDFAYYAQRVPAARLRHSASKPTLAGRIT